jgi:hypothetical protein
MKARIAPWVSFFALSMICFAARAGQFKTTVIYDDRVSEITDAGQDAGQLWITTVDLNRATGFELKPQGVCHDELCFPVPKSRQQEFVRKGAGKMWFNLVPFAKLVRQPVAHDEALSTWYFGLRSDQRQSLSSLKAPDFSLPDMSGKIHSLSDSRGKKVLLITWASW